MELKLERKVRRIGDSLTVSIPAEAVKDLKISEGELLDFDIVNGGLLYTKKKEEK